MAVRRACLALFSAPILTLLVSAEAIAGSPTRSVFDFACATTDAFLGAHLAGIVAESSANLAEGAGRRWADRAVASDIDGDGKAEFLVPLACGATGNCTWGVFGGSPLRALGRIEGTVIRVRRTLADKPSVIAYTHGSAGGGRLTTYSYRDGTLAPGGALEVSVEEAVRTLGCDGATVGCCK